MNNLLSYCGLIDAKIRAYDKDLLAYTYFFFNFFPKNLHCALNNFVCYTVEQYILIQTVGCKTMRFKEAIPNKIEQIWNR